MILIIKERKNYAKGCLVLFYFYIGLPFANKIMKRKKIESEFKIQY